MSTTLPREGDIQIQPEGDVVKDDHQLDDDIEGVNRENDEETREEGAVKWSVYKKYWFCVGAILSPTIILSLALMQTSRNLTDVWLANWVSNNDTDVKYYLSVYGSIAVSNTFFTLARAFLFAYGGIVAAKSVHRQLLDVILSAKMIFFDATPIGRIVNRFSSDTYAIDDSLPFILNIFLAQLFGVVGPIIVCLYSVPWLILLLVPLTFVYYDVQKKYRPTSRDLKRIGSVSLSPVYVHLSETVSGLVTIRAMKATSRFKRENEFWLEANQRAQYSGVAAAQWLDIRLQLIGCGVVAGVALLSIFEHHLSEDGADPGFVGLAVSYSLGLTGKIAGLVSSFTETERELVAVERCYQYIDDVETEDQGRYRDELEAWPAQGRILFEDVAMQYRPHLPLVLNGFNLDIAAKEKLGIVGRTGSGKSSLFQCLFRMVELYRGRITIDDEDIADVALKQLRSKMCIVPQEPFMFDAPVRANLAPGQDVDDARLWRALEKTRLRDTVTEMGGLDAKIGSLSAGQKQLFCIARAALSTAKVICVDEATANVDLETDDLISAVLKETLVDRTVLTIAHRTDKLEAFSDRVIRMSEGNLTT